MADQTPLTEQQKRQYLEDANELCPYCGSSEITAQEFDPYGTYRKVECETCDRNWKEVYELKTIEDA